MVQDMLKPLECPQCSVPMHRHLAREHTLIDQCPLCSGLWLDEGEINFLIDNKRYLNLFLKNGLNNLKPTELKCPHCEGQLFEGTFPSKAITAETCGSCRGLFIEGENFKQLNRKPLIQSPRSRKKPVSFKKLLKLPSLGLASFGVFTGLYSILFVSLVLLDHYLHLPSWGVSAGIGVFIGLQFILSPWITDLSLRLLGSLKWVELSDLPEHLQLSIAKMTQDKKIPLPQFGIIDDHAPNAFTYGRTPRSARIVLTKGIFELLGENEIEAVVAHELGHVYHWDFLLMTFAQAVPSIFYQLYRTLTDRSASKNSRQKESGLALVGVIAYAIYLVSSYLVLHLSRTREYWADRFSGEITGNPNNLITALIKIAYGLSSKAPHPDQNSNASNAGVHHRKLGAVASLGISEIESSKTFGLYAAQEHAGYRDRGVEPEISKEIMQWDFWNPWASFHELQSTHPLTAKRIQSLALLSKVMGIDSPFEFDHEQPESYWDDFLIDVFFYYSIPVFAIGFLLIELFLLPPSYRSNELFSFWSIAPRLSTLSAAVFGLGLGTWIRSLFRYPKRGFHDFTVSSLLRKIKVSAVRGIPVRLHGKVIGRGIPGYVFSEDLVLQDSSGLIFLDYQQPIDLFTRLFGIFRAGKYISKEVVLEGWYRRGPFPYVEIYRIATRDQKLRSKSYTLFVKRFFALLLMGSSLYLAARLFLPKLL